MGSSSHVADPHSLGGAAFDELEAESALADPSVSRDTDDLRSAGAAPLHGLIEQCLLRLPAR